MWTAGAPPPPSVMKKFAEELGVTVQTAYGLTETYGPISKGSVKFDPSLTLSASSPSTGTFASTRSNNRLIYEYHIF